jgi:hypothetical protein
MSSAMAREMHLSRQEAAMQSLSLCLVLLGSVAVGCAPVPSVGYTRTTSGSVATPSYGTSSTDGWSDPAASGFASHGSATPGSVSPAAIAPAPLDDAEIATIAISLALGEAERARVVESKGKDPALRQFAERLLADAPAAPIETMDLAPRSSALDDSVTNATRSATEYLGQLQGEAVDRALLEEGQRSLATAILVIDQELVPRATNLALKSSLERMSAVFANELAYAQSLSL